MATGLSMLFLFSACEEKNVPTTESPSVTLQEAGPIPAIGGEFTVSYTVENPVGGAADAEVVGLRHVDSLVEHFKVILASEIQVAVAVYVIFAVVPGSTSFPEHFKIVRRNIVGVDFRREVSCIGRSLGVSLEEFVERLGIGETVGDDTVFPKDCPLVE